MFKKNTGFLLFELISALSILVLFLSICSYYIYINLQIKKNIINRLKNLDLIINEIETVKGGKKGKYNQVYDIKLSQKLDNFRFVSVKKKVNSLNRETQNLILIGPVK